MREVRTIVLSCSDGAGCEGDQKLAGVVWAAGTYIVCAGDLDYDCCARSELAQPYCFQRSTAAGLGLIA